MGASASSTSKSKSGKTVGGKGGGGGGSSTIRRSSIAAKVVDIDGGVQEFRQPIQAQNIISQKPNCFLCRSESMSIGTQMMRSSNLDEFTSCCPSPIPINLFPCQTCALLP